MEPDVIFRKSVESDLGEVVDIAYETRSVHWMGPDMSLDELRSIYFTFVSGRFPGERILYVASLDGRVVGFLSMLIGSTRAHLSCAVRNNAVKRGIAKGLVLTTVESHRCTMSQEFNAVCRVDNIAASRTLLSCDFKLRGPWSKDPDNCLEYYLNPAQL